MNKIKTKAVAGWVLSSLMLGMPASADTLQDALIAAYHTNPTLKAQQAEVRAGDENYIQARAAGRFTADLTGSASHAEFRVPTAAGRVSADGDPLSGQVQIIQPLYQGGRVRALKSQAKAGIYAAREGLRAVEQSVLLSVANAYSDVRRDEQIAVIRRNNIRVLMRQLEAASERFEAGVGNRTDMAQSRSRLAAAEVGLAQADAQLQISRSEYIRVVGHPANALSPVPEFALPSTLEAAVQAAKSGNPQLAASHYSELAAQAGIDVAKAAGRPVVALAGTLQGSRQQFSNFPDSESATLTASVTVPIFSGGLNRSRVRAAEHAKTQARFRTRDLERTIAQSVARAWAGLDAAKRSLKAGQTQVDAARIAFEGVELEQEVGTRTTLDVLNAEQELLNAKIGVINAENALEKAQFALLAAVGVFDAQSLQLPIELYDPNDNFEAVKEDGLLRWTEKYVPERVERLGEQLMQVPEKVWPTVRTDEEGLPRGTIIIEETGGGETD